MQPQPVSVLLADDDEDDRLLFLDALKEIRIKTDVQTVNDGIELMNYLIQPGSIKPAVLFLDINMPLKSGLDCLREIKGMENLKEIVIAIYSTSGSEQDIEDTFVQGANVYIRKPNDYGELKRILEKVITINWQYHTSGLNRDNFLFSF